jgi:hypothetical protein
MTAPWSNRDVLKAPNHKEFSEHFLVLAARRLMPGNLPFDG